MRVCVRAHTSHCSMGERERISKYAFIHIYVYGSPVSDCSTCNSRSRCKDVAYKAIMKNKKRGRKKKKAKVKVKAKAKAKSGRSGRQERRESCG